MNEIKVDPKEVRKAAAKIRSCVSQIKEKSRTFNDIEEEIENSWKSRYTRQYLNCLESTENDVARSLRSLETTAGNLDRIAAAVEKAEAEIGQAMSGGGSGGGGGRSF